MSQKKQYYEGDFIAKQLSFYAGLPEKQRRHFLAMEYERVGLGSKRYLARTFGGDEKLLIKADEN